MLERGRRLRNKKVFQGKESDLVHGIQERNTCPKSQECPVLFESFLDNISRNPMEQYKVAENGNDRVEHKLCLAMKYCIVLTGVSEK